VRYLYLIILFITCFSNLGAQDKNNLDHPEHLAKWLTHKAGNEREKVDAIFFWITENIEYDIETYHKVERRYPEFNIAPTYDTAGYLKRYNDEVAKIVLNKRKAICDGYSRLFKSLCDYSGIQCEVVTGMAKIPLETKPSPHAWNAVRLNNKWQLVDATWASGSLSLSEDSFTRKLDTLYYLTPPEVLIIDHFPDDQKWTLLEREYTYDQFLNHPAQSTHMYAKGLMDYHPKSKLITPGSDGLIELSYEFKSSFPPYDITIIERDIRSKYDHLDITVSAVNYDSIMNVYPDFGQRIPKIEIVRTDVAGNRLTFFVKPLTKNLKGLLVYIGSSLPCLEYDVDIE